MTWRCECPSIQYRSLVLYVNTLATPSLRRKWGPGSLWWCVCFLVIGRYHWFHTYVSMKLGLGLTNNVLFIKQGIPNYSTLIPLLSYFPYVFILWLKIKMWHKLSYACPIIMNFSEDWGVGTFYLPKFQLHRLINNGDLLADRNRWKDTHRDWIWYSLHIAYRVE